MEIVEEDVHNEEDIHMSSITQDASGYGFHLDLLSMLY